MLLRDAINIPTVLAASDFVIKLDAGVEHAQRTIDEYVVTESLAESYGKALDYLSHALETSSDQGAFVHGSFGSGKSHFMAVLHLLINGNPAARALPGLQSVIAAHESALAANVLTLDYHLIGATSLESALYSGYLRQIAHLHPEAALPLLHKSDALFANAATLRAQIGDEAFFGGLPAASGWGGFAGGWDAASYDAAAAGAIDATDRLSLASDLVATYFTGYVQTGEWLGIEEGLQVMAQHAKSLGYEAVVLFLDELVLWLATHLGDSTFVHTEGSKVAKLVEAGIGRRAVPMVSFVARQRDLKDFLGDSIPGAERVAIGQTFTWWEDRFNKIELKANDLSEIAHKRLLEPTSPEGAAALAAALADVKRNTRAWDALLTDEQGVDEVDFARVYPFSPALVNTLVALSGLLQRERTALKVMAQLLVSGRDILLVSDVIPVGDLYDVMVEGGDTPLTDEMRVHFAIARELYRSKLRPILLAEHRLTEADVAGSRPGAIADGAPSSVAIFFTDDRLVKTLLVAALAPATSALRGLTASRLAYLNHGTVATPVPGTEVTSVLTKVRSWARQVGELQVGDGQDPVITLALSGIDYDSILERVRQEDTVGTRRSLLRRLVFEQMGVSSGDALLAENLHPITWRGSKRTVDIAFGNVRDANEIPDDAMRANGDKWKLVIDYPFDAADFSPNDDLARIDRLRESGLTSRTVAWVPGFLTTARREDLGTLVLLEYLLAGAADAFEQHAAHLPTESRQPAKALLENRRRSLRESLGAVIRQAYGAARMDPRDIDTTYGDFVPFATLDPGLTLQPLVGATLADAMSNLIDQMLTSQFPDHPRFEPGHAEVKKVELNTVLTHVSEAVAAGGRVDPVETAKRGTMTRVANPLSIGKMLENHYVFNQANFTWRNFFTQRAAEEGITTVPMTRIRAWLSPYGLAREVENLLAAAWALLDDKQWVQAGGTVQITAVEQVNDNLELREPTLPPEGEWLLACDRAAVLFGVTVSRLRSAANVGLLGAGIRQAAGQRQNSAADLVGELASHAALLGITAASPRTVSAAVGRDLVARLAVERDDVVLVSTLAGWTLAEEPQALAKSMSSAATVTTALRSATWSVLEPVSTIGAEDERYTAARTVMTSLAGVAAAEELHSPLASALSAAVSESARLLAEAQSVLTRVGPPVGPPIVTPPYDPPVSLELPQPVTVNDIRLDGIDDQFDELRAVVRAALQEHPGRTLNVQWWLA